MPTPDFSKIWASNSPLPEFVFTDEEYTEGWDFVGSAPPTKNQFDAWFKYVDERLKWLYDEMQSTASKLYPVGSVYISFKSTDPSTLFGGTWVRLKDTFLLANGDSFAPNTTGGSVTKTIGINNLPAHTHTRGTMNITGSITVNAGDDEVFTYADRFTNTGALAVSDYTTESGGARGGSGSGYNGLTFDASRTGAWTGETSSVGGGLPLNIMPPYTTVFAWRRTA